MKQNTGNQSLSGFLTGTFCDNVLIYTVILTTSVMYHYRSSMTLIYCLASILLTAVLFKIFNFIARHKFIGPLTYIILFIAGVSVVSAIVRLGSSTYNIAFWLWFITPQDVLEYSPEYTLAMFLLMNGFFASVVYYFTKIRYRIFMGFLIFIIPFSIYGKEYEKMPVYFILSLAALYFITMINYRQISVASDVKIVNKPEMWKSVMLFTLIFGSGAAILPKPEIKANRTYLEMLLDADEFTDKLLKTVGIFSDKTDNSSFRKKLSNKTVYNVVADENLRLRTRLFTNYNYKDDSWNTEHDDTYYLTSPLVDYENDITSISRALAAACDESSKFAEKYNLSGLSADTLALPELKKIKIYPTKNNTYLVPVPTLYSNVENSGGRNEIKRSINGAFFKEEGYFTADSELEMSYYSDSFLSTPSQNILLSQISYADNYFDMLFEAEAVLVFAGRTSEAAALAAAEAEDYSDWLDYGDNKTIKEIAENITEGLYSDYDKAKAIESYFTKQKFTYDLDFKKDKGDNAVTFLTKSHTGVCYEFATAMVLIARASGIPARYAEGYNMSHYSEENKYTYSIREKDAHGFPELFIGSVGWVSFEPTVASDELEDEAQQQNAATAGLFKTGIALAVFGGVIFLIFLIYPAVYQKIFVIRIKKAKPDNSVRLIVKRLQTLYSVGNSRTADELAEKILAEDFADVSLISDYFNKSVYGGEALSEFEKNNAVTIYLTLWAKRKENKKNNRKSKKGKKQAV